MYNQNSDTMPREKMELRDAVLPILPSGRVAFELCPDFPAEVISVDASVTTCEERDGRVCVISGAAVWQLSEAYRIEEVQYYLDVARNIQREIDFQNSISL